MAPSAGTYDEGDESEPLVAPGAAAVASCGGLRRAAKAAALALAAASAACAVLAPGVVWLHRPPRDLAAAPAAAADAVGLAATAAGDAVPEAHGGAAGAVPAAATQAPTALATTSREMPVTTTPEVCRDTPGWTNGYTACNNYNPVDPDCTKDGVTCHFYKRKPRFCQKGMNRPWQHCCACGGGSTFNGSTPTTTEPTFHIPGMPHWKWMRHMHMPKWEKKLSHKLGKMEDSFEKKMKPVETAVGEIYDGLNQPDYNQPPKLGGNPVERINRTALTVLLTVVGVTILGCCLEPVWARCVTPGRPKLWSTLLLLASYGLLVPGLSSIVFSFDIIANIVGHRVNIQPDVTQETCTESVSGLIHLLYHTGSTVGAAMIFAYAVVVPAVKLLLLAVGELLRFSSSRCGVIVSRTCIIFVQYISKWASPDMFAYIFLVHLIRDLEEAPLILTAAQLDEGFTCFSVFCVCSSISSLGIGVPKLPVEETDEAEAKRLSPPLLLCCAGRRCAVAVAAALAAAFAGLFYVGLAMPCMSLRIDEGRLYPPRGPVPYSAKPVVEALAIPELLRSDISLQKCLVFLAGEIYSGEANSVFALALWAIFVVAFTVVDMLLLVLAALRLRWPSGAVSGKEMAECGRGCGPAMLRPCPFMSVARVLRKLSMLDVSLMGVLVMCFSLQMYAKDGIIIAWREGLWVLGAAEAVHTLCFCLVSSAVDHVNAQDVLLAGSEEPSVRTRCGPRLGGCSCTRQRWLSEDHDDPSAPNQDFSLNCCSAKKRLTKAESAVWSSAGPAAPVNRPLT